MKTLEVIVTTLEEALLAEKYGANRLELIDGFTDGGCSPDLVLAQEVAQAVAIPVNVMVRPHGNGFLLDKYDMQRVYKELDFLLSQTKINGVVFGSLNSLQQIDLTQLDFVCQLVANSNINLTFHRAIDNANDLISNFKLLLKLYQQYNLPTHLLTSGGYARVKDGINVLLELINLIHLSNVNMRIIAGSGINPENLNYILANCQDVEIHMGTGLRNAYNQLDAIKFETVLNILKQY